jgi:hypothetical protein
VYVGATDGRRRNPDDGFTGSRSRFLDLLDPQIVDTAKTTAFIISITIS